MKFLAVVALAGTAMAVPTTTTTTPACPGGLYSLPRCCATFVLGVIGLDCTVPSRTPNSPADLRSVCSDIGKQGGCCFLDLASQSLVCTPVSAN
ncbi:fungal hydrophobin domain-containing protein [Pochonia chlamydosporia 170]|uniref:Fungal hydrophobin domain-containing protein n=1 Tax=Pochonia chlamydosporia 170 TaxID=1380566 RepID=A0A179G1I8_METCM|nr:fungal hydrophobin domain-containing protein [Pochonia chlamydosporia 170]OAQ71310.1 fungal hydrophobin domain-containing protein [Pochonia chlamydosporia 170]